MSQIAIFLQDLSLIMVAAGLATVIFRKLKQPLVLGYIIVGIVLGKYTPPFSLILNEAAIKTLAELGVIFLMFSLGLEFNLRKLFCVGGEAFITAFCGIALMMIVGYEIGHFFNWKKMDAIFLGAMLSISSTTIIVKALNELKMKQEKFAQIIFGILIIEDILAIAILAILSSMITSSHINIHIALLTLIKLLVFLVASMVIGVLTVPKILNYIARFNSKEMLLVSVLGICFGFSLLVIKLGFSAALGAFLIGAIMAESDILPLIEKSIEPLTNMFSAIFFVSIGLLVDPHVIMLYWFPILVITFSIIIVKILVATLSQLLIGQDKHNAMRVGMGLAQIGEFSFIIASLGVSLKVMSPFLYPIIVTVSAITTFLTPYLIKSSDSIIHLIENKCPSSVLDTINNYTSWVNHSHHNNKMWHVKKIMKECILQIFINLIFVLSIFFISTYLSHYINVHILFTSAKTKKALLLSASLIASLPFLIAIYRRLKGLSLIFFEIWLVGKKLNYFQFLLRQILIEIIPIAGMIAISLMIVFLSTGILLSFKWLVLIFLFVLMIATFLRRWFIKVHSKLQISLLRTLNKKSNL